MSQPANHPIDPNFPYVVAYPAQEPAFVQPTFGRIFGAVFFANVATGILGAFIYTIIQIAG